MDDDMKLVMPFVDLQAENQRLREALRWMLGVGKRHGFGCICVRCEDAYQLAHNDGADHAS